MLQSLILLKLRNSEFIQFFADFIAIITRHNTEPLLVEEQLSPVAENLEKAKTLYRESKGNDISEELESIDDARDDCITGISGVAEGYSNHYVEATREAADLILNKIGIFGSSIARQNYPTQTATLDGIANIYNTDADVKNAATLLHLNAWFEKMESLNVFFNKRLLDRIDDKAKQSDDKLKELRNIITQHYYILRNHLNAHATLSKDIYEPVMSQLNELIEEYNGILKRRAGKNTEPNEAL